MKQLEMHNGEVRDADGSQTICNGCQRPGATVEGADGEPYHHACRIAFGT